MMRTIKFRAWHKEQKKMYSVGYLHFAPDGDLFGLLANENMQWGNLLAVTDYELMQFTGLIDKRGKEVYEGDIYRNLDNGLIGKFYYLNGPGGYALHTRENNADGSPYNMLPFAQLDTTNFEVIGNIYENQELLEAGHATS